MPVASSTPADGDQHGNQPTIYGGRTPIQALKETKDQLQAIVDGLTWDDVLPSPPSVQERTAPEQVAAEQEFNQAKEEVLHWAQAILTAWNVGDMPRECPLHRKLREVMITFREKRERLYDADVKAWNLCPECAKPLPDGFLAGNCPECGHAIRNDDTASLPPQAAQLGDPGDPRPVNTADMEPDDDAEMGGEG